MGHNTVLDQLDAVQETCADVNPSGPDAPDIHALAGAVAKLADVVKHQYYAHNALAKKAEEVSEPYQERFAAPQAAEVDTDALGSALERAVDSAARDLRDGLEDGLTKIADAIARVAP